MLRLKDSFAITLILAILAQNVLSSILIWELMVAIKVLCTLKSFSRGALFRCRYSDEQCMLRLANNALKELQYYIPDYDIVPWEPVDLENINITISSSKSTRIKLSIEDLRLRGLTNGRIRAINYIPVEGHGRKDFYLDAHSSHERLSFTARYKLNATINALKYIGDGELVQNYYGVDCFSKFLLASEFKSGETFFRVKNPLMNCGHNRGDFHLMNLNIGGYIIRDYEMDDPWLTPIFLKFFDYFAKVVAADLQKLLQKVPYENMFLTIPMEVDVLKNGRNGDIAAQNDEKKTSKMRA